MTTYTIAPVANCKYCYGSGTICEPHPYGSTVAYETLTCDCVTEQLPEEYNERQDWIEIDPAYAEYDHIKTQWANRPEADYYDYS